jgi:hypothetical protein
VTKRQPSNAPMVFGPWSSALGHVSPMVWPHTHNHRPSSAANSIVQSGCTISISTMCHARRRPPIFQLRIVLPRVYLSLGHVTAMHPSILPCVYTKVYHVIVRTAPSSSVQSNHPPHQHPKTPNMHAPCQPRVLPHQHVDVIY